ncbi:MAG: anhydro-N-acetylmuramic acid kinase [Candidatus Sedimenticola endophacoides]
MAATADHPEPLFIGLISGTSMDGIDAVLVRFGGAMPRLLGHLHSSWPTPLRHALRAAADSTATGIDRLCELDNLTAERFARSSLDLLHQCDINPTEVAAIGSHGQTLRHKPDGETPFTLQIGNPSLIAERCGITVVADFRRRDMAAGGQGAPLVPAFHAAMFTAPDEERVVLNLGGIANITHLPAGAPQKASGFDTGPANTLLDYWIRHCRDADMDCDGAWAATGSVHRTLLEAMLADPYFSLAPPKSTGPDYFSPSWLRGHLGASPTLGEADVQATLTALSAESIRSGIAACAPDCRRIIVCGGGWHNKTLLRELARRHPGLPIESSERFGIATDQVEATAFAWLARQTLNHLPGNIPRVTGARRPAVLGGIYPAG